MGQPGAYLSVERQEHALRPAAEAVQDFDDIVICLPEEDQRLQASRCMACGVPFCQSGLSFNGSSQTTGCPLHNLIPETNDLLFRGRWDDAAGRLSLTNPFPEFTGRVCPAPCELACNLGLHDDPVTIHDNERAISDWLWEQGMEPLPPAPADAPLVSVVGSGPAGLAAAWELARRGIQVQVYERDERPGGLLMYGIPSMKLPKWVVERRVELMEQSGIRFHCGVDAAGKAPELIDGSAAVILACGARTPRTLDVPGADLDGVHFALEYLAESTRALLGGRQPGITAQGKDVVVIGGGDTGVDCVATALRQGAKSVRQVIRSPRPPESADAFGAWPGPRNQLSSSYGQQEATQLFGEDPRVWFTDTLAFLDGSDGGDGSGGSDGSEGHSIGSDGGKEGSGQVSAVQVQGRRSGDPVSELPAQLVLIAKGFTGAEQQVLDAFSGSGKVYLAGDARTGSSLVATAMADGLQVASQVACKILDGD